MPYRIRQAELRNLMRRSVKISVDLREVCGLLVDNGHFLQLVEVRNTCRRPCGFCLHRGDWRGVDKSCDRRGNAVVGTFHSHILSPAKPGDADIKGAEDGSLMLILDTIERNVRLWRIRGKRSHALKHELM